MVIPLFGDSFLFLRHAETNVNAAGLVAGSRDLPLSIVGATQARDAAERLAARDFAAIWASPQQRARRTAEIVAQRTKRPIRFLPELAERNWGAWEGQPRGVLPREATPPGGGESPAAFHARILAGLSKIKPPFPVLIVAHSGAARIIEAVLAGGAQPFHGLANAEVAEWRRAPDGSWSRRRLFAPVIPLSPKAHKARQRSVS